MNSAVFGKDSDRRYLVCHQLAGAEEADFQDEIRGVPMKKIVIGFGMDLLIAAVLLGEIYWVNYRMPQKGIAAGVMEPLQAEESTSGRADARADQKEEIAMEAQAAREEELQAMVDSGANGLQTTRVLLDSQDWHRKFADKFTDQVISTDTSYTSPDISIRLTYGSGKTDRVDTSEGGKHVRYGTDYKYVLADIYVGDITCLRTCFARDTYGVGYDEKLTDMSARLQSILAVNGDSYSNSRHKNNGTIIRNGLIYRAKPTDMETCVLNWDGTMNIYAPQELDTQKLIDSGAYQSWIFGPSLLDENGKAKDSFQTWDYIRESHPRTALGYYEPGHYCLLVADGRQNDTRGIFPGSWRGCFLERILL